MSQLSSVKVSSTNHGGKLLMSDNPGGVRSHITCVVCQIQKFDFDCNLAGTRKVIIWIPPALDLKPLY
jgi:hypothetical protein